MKTRIAINEIVRETAKAILVNVPVSYNANAPKGREIWFPASLVSKTSTGRSLDVESWFLGKLRRENAFHGYEMCFDVVK